MGNSTVVRARAGTRQGARGRGTLPLSRVAWQRSRYNPAPPTVTYRWRSANTDLSGGAFSAFASTIYANDGSVGDTTTHLNGGTTTGLASDIQASFSGTTPTITLQCELNFASATYLTNWRATYAITTGGAGSGATAARTFEYLDAGTGLWVSGGTAGITSDIDAGAINVIITSPGITVPILGIRLTLTETRTATGSPQLSIDIYDFRAVASTPLPAPVLAANFCSATATDIAFSWTPQEVSEGYRLYRDGVPYQTFFNPAMTGFTLLSQAAGVTYTWTLRTEHGGLESADSNALVGAPLSPTVPANLRATADYSLPGTNLLIQWDAAPGSPTYTLTQNGVTIYVGLLTQFLSAGLAIGAYYDYVLSAASPCGSASVSLTVKTAGWREDCGGVNPSDWRQDCAAGDTTIWRVATGD